MTKGKLPPGLAKYMKAKKAPKKASRGGKKRK